MTDRDTLEWLTEYALHQPTREENEMLGKVVEELTRLRAEVEGERIVGCAYEQVPTLDGRRKFTVVERANEETWPAILILHHTPVQEPDDAE